MTRSTAQILHAAADLLEEEGAWTQDGYAHNSHGYTLLPTGRGHWVTDVDGSYDDNPVCWCALGAIAQVTGIGEGQFDENPAVEILGTHVLGYRGSTPSSDIACWNDEDERTQTEVVRAFRAAAKKADDRTNGQKQRNEGEVE